MPAMVMITSQVPVLKLLFDIIKLFEGDSGGIVITGDEVSITFAGSQKG